jgi:hypothetical protein
VDGLVPIQWPRPFISSWRPLLLFDDGWWEEEKMNIIVRNREQTEHIKVQHM